MNDTARRDLAATDKASFNTTRWTLVVNAAGGETPEASKALNDLCRAYWLPVYSEVRSRGHDKMEAEDITQEFFLQLLQRQSFGRADREKGRFRSFLLGALNYFLKDHWRQKMAAKRGDGNPAVSIDSDAAEHWFQQVSDARTATPAEAFDHRWALVLMERALAELREEYQNTGRAAVFSAVQPYLAAAAGRDGYAAGAAEAGLSDEAFAVAVHRLRKRFRECVREQVAMTVADPTEVMDEMQYLFRVSF